MPPPLPPSPPQPQPPSSPKILKNCLRSSIRSNNNNNNNNNASQLLQRKVSFQNEHLITRCSSSSSSYVTNGLKPEPPKRSEYTKLTPSPKKFENSVSAPPKEFLRDLQKVMSKKWQVAQKCQLNQLDTPYEVLGFRDPPSFYYDAYYKETNVSNWVQEHYGSNADNFYENIADVNGTVVPHLPNPQIFQSPYHYSSSNDSYCSSNGHKVPKRLPPPPPKRSDSTHLTTSSKM